MDNILAVLKKTALFQQIKEKDICSLLKCLSAQQKLFAKNEIIFGINEKITAIGIILSGKVQIMKEDILGNRTILAVLGERDLFGEAFSFAKVEKIPVNVIAQENCEILMINYRNIISACALACPFHRQLVDNILLILAKKNVYLNQKIEHLGKRTTRDKLISFLSMQAQEAQAHTFQIPYNRQELADYLCVDRSAMSHELSKLGKEGMISFHKNQFTLYDPIEYDP